VRLFSPPTIAVSGGKAVQSSEATDSFVLKKHMIRGISALTRAFLTLAVASAVSGADPPAAKPPACVAKPPAAKPPAPKTKIIPNIESNAKKTLARQWLQWKTNPVHWETALRALELAVQGGSKFPEALAVLALGYDGMSAARSPYAVPAQDADVFWDWLAGAAPHVDQAVTDETKLQPALCSAEEIVDDYFTNDNQGLMEKVDAGFAANSPRVAIFQLLSYAANDTRKAMEEVVVKKEEADASDSLKTEKHAVADAASTLRTQIDAIADSITTRTTNDSSGLNSTVATDVQAIKTAATGNINAVAAADLLVQHVQSLTGASAASLKALIDQLPDAAKRTLKGAVDKYSADAHTDADQADTAHKADMDALKNAGAAVDESLKKLESIRLCYASVDKGVNGNNLNYRKKLSDYVAGKFHRRRAGS